MEDDSCQDDKNKANNETMLTMDMSSEAGDIIMADDDPRPAAQPARHEENEKKIIVFAEDDHRENKKGRSTSNNSTNTRQQQKTRTATTTRPPDPLRSAGLYSRLVFGWAYPVLKVGMERPLEESDLPDIPAADTSEYNLQYFQKLWSRECARAAHQNSRPSLHRALLTEFLSSLWFVQPMMLLGYTARVVQAVVLGYLIESFEGANDLGYLWASVLVLCAAVALLEHHHVFFFTWRKGMQYRLACVAAIYDKSLRLSSTHQDTSASYGRIMNLASNDVERFILAALFVNQLFWAPAQSAAILVVGCMLVGPSFAAGFGVLLLVLVPLQSYLSKRFAVYRSKIAAITDQRVTFCSQAVRGARVMKMSGYEWRFERRIQEHRRREIAQIAASNSLKAWNEALFFATNVVISVVIYVVHVFWSRQTLSPGMVFTVFTLVNLLQQEMSKHLALGVMSVSEVTVSISRIQRFLEFPERGNDNDDDDNDNDNKGVKDATTNDNVIGNDNNGGSGTTEVRRQQPQETKDSSEHDENAKGSSVIAFTNVHCYWNAVKRVRHQNINNGKGMGGKDAQDGNDATEKGASSSSSSSSCSSSSRFRQQYCALDNVSVEFGRGQITAVIGTVGSGKSALLQAIVEELPVSSGKVSRLYKTLSYAAQDPWIMDGTVRENILLGRDMDRAWYDTVVAACGLVPDFDQFFRGDETVVGDRGVQCSGGQRARIGLARALYRDADVLVADDPLSAVDAKVGRQLYHEAVLGLAVRRGKSVVLATHQHQYIREDCEQTKCVLMVRGRVACVGTYQDCVTASNGKLTAHAAASDADAWGEEDSATLHPIASDLTESSTEVVNKKEDANKIDDNDNDANNKRQGEEATTARQDDEHDDDNADDDDEDDDQKEMTVQGLVQASTYWNYVRAMGGIWVAIFLFVLFCATQASVLLAIAWVGVWAELPTGRDQRDATAMVATILGLTVAVVVLGTIRAFVSYKLVIRASRRLHDQMTTAVLRAKIEFFDTNPLGRIMNRFSADVGSNDDLLPQTLFDFATMLFIILGAVITTVVTLPFTLLAIPPLLWFFLWVRNIFVTSSRELKRHEGMARSPIFAMLSESLGGGIATIRANDSVPYFRNKFQRVHDAHSRAFFAFIASSRWVGWRMDSIMFLFLSLASFLAVVFHRRGWFDVPPAIFGLSLSMLIQLAGIFQWCIRQSAECVNLMVSVERVVAFGKLEPEAPLQVPNVDEALVERGWPANGSIDVEELSVRYRSNLPLALDRVTFHIPQGARVGVVGRTGSGKSTVVQTLFRLLEAEHGRIVIDGQDISKVGLHTLRTKISVIPQVPTLFSGCTVRENLDLFGLHSDDAIREVLEDCHLSRVIGELPRGWDSLVSEGGSNFSVGQRQLLCLARAILSRNKILVLDEATASVDRRTDELLQRALQASFRDGTILAVAHRLDTVIESDYVLVLGRGGRVLEYGPPAELIRANGPFAGMINDTGEAMSGELRRRAFRKEEEEEAGDSTRSKKNV